MNLLRMLRDSTGLDLSEATVERARRERMQAVGLTARVDYAPCPGTPEFEALVDLVVVPESWMLRDPAVFNAALRFVQRRILTAPQANAQVRILSLPCAGGEEPYSMAMALARAGIPAARCRIDAVDLSRAAIARARQGRYTRNAFRGADLAFRERWFTQEDDAWMIRPELRDYVCFRQDNLFTMGAGPDGGYDLVFCRNLLIYFDADGQRRAAEAIDALLAAGGMLLSGYAEVPAFCRHGYTPAPGRDVFTLHRQADVRGAAARRPVRMPAAPAAALPAVPLSAPGPAQAGPAQQDLLARARGHANAGGLLDAEAACRALLAARPDHAEACFLLGLVAESRGDAPEAQRCWRRCLYLQPEHYEALCSLALLHERSGADALAASLRQRASRIYQRRPRTRS